MDTNTILIEYLKNGFENILKDAMKASIFNPKESLFMASFILAAKKAGKQRNDSEQKGVHIPPFLIASITNSCNLHCAGCYARANQSCNDQGKDSEMSTSDWKRIFEEAQQIGISFILLAGGEPLLRRDIIETAATFPHILFPIFTNGTKMESDYIRLFDKNRNLIPVISIEGDEQQTDSRRGKGTYKLLCERMEEMRKHGILYGASVTVTSENSKTVTSDSFVKGLSKNGCKVVFYVEYVPVTTETEFLAPNLAEKQFLDASLQKLRPCYQDMILLSFPGDEKEAGGCLAAGRGFFHINYHGGVEPCPFSPYSDTNIKNTTLLNALNSPFFLKLKNTELLHTVHNGGCVLFEHEDEVRELLK